MQGKIPGWITRRTGNRDRKENSLLLLRVDPRQRGAALKCHRIYE